MLLADVLTALKDSGAAVTVFSPDEASTTAIFGPFAEACWPGINAGRLASRADASHGR